MGANLDRSDDLLDAFAPDLAGGDRDARLASLAELLWRRGREADAIHVARRLVVEARRDSEAAQRARRILTADLPRWHYGMLQDVARAEAYDRAIRKAVRPGSLVLDVGSGTGLLAMMAARAGAGMVISCERLPVMAEIATAIVARNGYADRITIVAKDARDLQVGVDLPRRADMVISELITNNLLEEWTLPVIEAVRRDLLAPGAIAIPQRGRVHVALLRDPACQYAPLGQLSGFDLSEFNQLRPFVYPRSTATADDLLSESAVLFDIDLTAVSHVETAAASVALVAAREGVLGGVLQWISLELDDETVLDTGPGASSEHWGFLATPLDRPVEIDAGRIITVHGRHERTDLMLWTDVA